MTNRTDETVAPATPMIPAIPVAVSPSSTALAVHGVGNAVPDSDFPARRRLGRERVLFEERSLDEVEKRLHEVEQGNFDVICTNNTFNFTERGTLRVNGEEFGFTDYSFRQLATIIGFPHKTLSQSPLGVGRASRQAIVNHWIEQQEGKSFLVRLKRSEVKQEEEFATVGRVRGVLYALPEGRLPFSNLDIIQAIKPYLKSYNMGIQLGFVNETSFHLRTLFREEIVLGGKTLVGSQEVDRHAVGIHWVNSEVGKFPLKGDLLVYRQICKNGMIAQSERSGLFHKAHRFIDEGTVGTELQAAMEAARSRQNELLGGLRSLRDQRVENPEDELKKVLGMYKCPQDWIKHAIKAFSVEPMYSKYGVLQAITRGAKSLTADHRVIFEEMGGRYMLDNVIAGE